MNDAIKCSFFSGEDEIQSFWSLKNIFTDVSASVQWFMMMVCLAARRLLGEGERCSEVSKLVPFLT